MKIILIIDILKIVWINIKFFNVDEYKIIKSIGEGTYGTIYEVQNKKTNQKFAMKKVIAKDLEKLELFIKSFEITSSLNNEYIIDIMGSWNWLGYFNKASLKSKIILQRRRINNPIITNSFSDDIFKEA